MKSAVDNRSSIIVSCWLAVAVIASVYMIVFADKIGDILFGVFMPVGLLVIVAVIVTLLVNNSQPQRG
jgi:hypothetical protein